jgi:transcriptional regulator with XRE-family HTH domain
MRLRSLRLKLNWSQEDLAECAATSVHFISLIERGVNAPSFETICTLSKCLGVDVKDMFDFPPQDETPRRVRRSLPTKKRSRRGTKNKR